MVSGNADGGRIFPGKGCNDNVKGDAVVNVLNGDFCLLQIGFDGFGLVGGNSGKDFQLFFRLSDNGSGGNRGGDSF